MEHNISIKRPKLLEYIFEFIGSFAICAYTLLLCVFYNVYDLLSKFDGLAPTENQCLGWFLVSITFGLSYIPFLFILLFAFSKSKCQCHFNPAVSLAFMLDREFENWKDSLFYVLAHMLAGIIAGLVIFLFATGVYPNTAVGTMDNPSSYGLGATRTQCWPEPSSSYTVLWFTVDNQGMQQLAKILIGILVETLGFIVFMLVILKANCISSKKHIQSLIIAVALGVMVTIELPFTGGSLNPARSLGPVIFGSWGSEGGVAWLDYIQAVVGPLAGACFAVLIHKAWLTTPKTPHIQHNTAA